LLFEAMALLSACGHKGGIVTAQVLTGGNVKRGQQLIYSYNCGSCDTIPGVTEVNGKIGPPLQGIADRVYVAGLLLNTPVSLSRWISRPQEIHAGTAMPDLGVTKKQADDIAEARPSLESCLTARFF
jgi:cytochrome c2